MASAKKQIRVSEPIKRILDRNRREGESYNDVLERLLGADESGDFDAGFGRWSDEQAERVREQREATKDQRKTRMRRLSSDEGADVDA